MDSSGAVIGIAVATFRDGQNLNLAVPVSYLSRLLALPPKPFISLGGHKANGETAKSMLDGVGAKPPVQNPPVSVEPLPPPVEEPKPPVLSPEIAEIERKAQAFHDQKRYSEAVPLFDKACSGGSGEACDRLGSAYDEGKYVAKDYSHAVALYSKACDAGSADGCSNLGSMYLNGRGVAKDDTKAVPLYSKACDAGSAKGCNGLGIMYETGRGVGLNQSRADCYHGGLDLCRYTTDYPHAVALYSKACDGGSADGCSNLGDMYLNGNGVAEDSSQALMLYSRACDAGSASGCSSIGLVYKKGYGVQKDKGRARQFFSKGCDMGNQWGCDQLKKM
jgi:TPR repeat protein